MEGFGDFIPVGDRPFQTPGAVKAAAANGRASDQDEPVFDQVEPRGNGRRERIFRRGSIWWIGVP